MKKYANCEDIIEYFKEKQSSRVSNAFDTSNSISSTFSMNFYNEYVVSYNQSLNLLINNSDEITKELSNAIYSKDNNSLFTDYYYIDLYLLSAIKFKDITKIKKKFKYTTLNFVKGLKSYVYCYNYDIKTIIYNDELFTSIKNQTPYQIIESNIAKSK